MVPIYFLATSKSNIPLTYLFYFLYMSETNVKRVKFSEFCSFTCHVSILTKLRELPLAAIAQHFCITSEQSKNHLTDG